ncbi:MAG TPA: hypothetical protein DEP84_26500 [Chloroflexi bacterium]|nr:hypothetical protein [Chloroflexota bacterium]
MGSTLHALTLTVGQSFEPLLQVACVFKPQRLIFILNRYYHRANGRRENGKDYGIQLRDLVQKLAEVSDLPDEWRPPPYEDEAFECCVVQEDTPTQVFRALREAFEQEKYSPPAETINVVDITGAKKSMVVGAFLFAVHSEIPITYVDFDEYEPTRGRPYGYTCKIGQIADPYHAFRLRDWERVRQLYGQYDFRGARQLIIGISGEPGIRDIMASHLEGRAGGAALYDDVDIEKVQRFYRILDVYEEWENGDYQRALDQATALGLDERSVPWAIRQLGEFWPSTAQAPQEEKSAVYLLQTHLALKQGTSTPSLFNRPDGLLAYARDEMAKIRRLIKYNEDYRSAFLRAAGLHEFLLKARLALLWFNDKAIRISVDDGPPLHPSSLLPPESLKWFKKLTDLTAEAMLKALNAPAQPLVLDSKWDKTAKRQKETFVQLPHAAQLDDYWRDITLLHFDSAKLDGSLVFTRLRNEAIHTHLSIPRSIAKGACDLVAAALKDFEDNWLVPLAGITIPARTEQVEAPRWAELCQICGLDFLPPKLRE